MRKEGDARAIRNGRDRAVEVRLRIGIGNAHTRVRRVEVLGLSIGGLGIGG